MITINVVTDYSDTPGARHVYEGPFSGEDFREVLLKPKFIEATESKKKLVINLDGGYGYPTSFLEEAFGGLARLFGSKIVLDTIELISEDEPAIIDEIKSYIKEAKYEGQP